MIEALCQLLFIRLTPEFSSAFSRDITTESPYQALMRAYLRVLDHNTRTIYIRTMSTVCTLNRGSGYEKMKALKPFYSLFQGFEKNSILNQRLILDMMDSVLEFSPLLPIEMARYCQLFSGSFVDGLPAAM